MEFNPAAQAFVPAADSTKPNLPVELLQMTCKELIVSEYEDSIRHPCPHKPYDQRPTAIGRIRNINKALYYSVVDEFYKKQPVSYTFTWEQICDTASSGGNGIVLTPTINLRGDEAKLQHVEFTIVVSCSSYYKFNCSWCTLEDFRLNYAQDPSALPEDWNASRHLYKEHNDGNLHPTRLDFAPAVSKRMGLKQSKHSPTQKPTFPNLRTLTLRFVNQANDDIWANIIGSMESVIVPLSRFPTLESPPTIELYSGRGKHNRKAADGYASGVRMATISERLNYRPMKWLVNPPFLHIAGKPLQTCLESGYTMRGLKGLLESYDVRKIPEREFEALWGAKPHDVFEVVCLELWGDSKNGHEMVLEHLKVEAREAWRSSRRLRGG